MNDKKVNLVWVSGGYHSAKALFEKIKEKLKDAETFYADERTEVTQLFFQIQSHQCFSSKRMIVITDLPEMTETQKKKFKGILESVNEDIFVIFFMIDPSEQKAIFNAVEKIGKIYNFDSSVLVREASSWIEDRCKELAITIEQKAITALIENCSVDSNKSISIDILEIALKKLILYSPNKKVYDTSDIIETSIFYENFVIWDLLNACDEKDYDKCTNLLAKAHHLGDRAAEGVAQMISTLLWKFRLLLFLKEKKAHKVDRQQILNEACSIRKISYEGMGFQATTKVDLIASGPNEGKPASIWTSNIATSALDGFYGRPGAVELYNRKDLYLIIKALEDASILVRSCQMENEAFLIADTIMMTICSVMESKNINRMQKSFMKTRI